MPEIPSDVKPPNAKPPNGMVALLMTLAHSGDKWVQLGTLGLIAFSGVGNWVATWNSADRNKNEIEISRRATWEANERVRLEVIKQVSEIHDWIQQAKSAFAQGNTDSAENRRMLVKLTQDVDELERKLGKGAP
jgi:hypothetical protein